jgi:hypothetical protein
MDQPDFLGTIGADKPQPKPEPEPKAEPAQRKTIADYIKQCCDICKENGLTVRQAWANHTITPGGRSIPVEITVACEGVWATWDLETGKLEMKQVSY